MQTSNSRLLVAQAEKLAALLANARPAAMRFGSEAQFMAVIGLSREPRANETAASRLS